MRRRTVIGLSAAVIGGLLAGTVAAIAGAGHCLERETMMRRMAAAAIDGALDEAQASAEQRATIHAARDRVFAVIRITGGSVARAWTGCSPSSRASGSTTGFARSAGRWKRSTGRSPIP